jgi:hypothetical protein
MSTVGQSSSLKVGPVAAALVCVAGVLDPGNKAEKRLASDPSLEPPENDEQPDKASAAASIAAAPQSLRHRWSRFARRIEFT